MILIIVLSLELLPGTDQDLAPHYFICNLIFKLRISKQRVPSSMPLLLTEEAPLLVF